MDDLFRTISRIRRAMPRNVDVMTLCDELERRITTKVEKAQEGCPACERRRKNQRNLMQKRRRAAKEPS